MSLPSNIRACVLTLSDKGSAGQRTDESGPAIAEMLKSIGAEIAHYEVLPDERGLIKQKLIGYALTSDLIVTNGGTGLSPRDVTPEATLEVLDYQIPGIPEAMRAYGMTKTPRAMLTRAVAGVRGRALIINVPGSRKAALECMEAVLEVLPHAIEKLKGSTEDCAR